MTSGPTSGPVLRLTTGKPLASILDIRAGRTHTPGADPILARAVGELLAGFWAEGGYCEWRGKRWNAWLVRQRRSGESLVADLRILAGKAWHAAGARELLHLLSVQGGESLVHASVALDAAPLGQAFLAWVDGPGPGTVTERVMLSTGQVVVESLSVKAMLRLHMGLYEEWVREQDGAQADA